MHALQLGRTTTVKIPREISAGVASIAIVLVALTLAVVVTRSGHAPAKPAHADALAAPAVVQFRDSERLDAVVAGDHLAAPAVVEFRRTEHSDLSGTSTDLLADPSSVAFRASERDEINAPVRSDPFATPAMVQFRNSERTE